MLPPPPRVRVVDAPEDRDRLPDVLPDPTKAERQLVLPNLNPHPNPHGGPAPWLTVFDSLGGVSMMPGRGAPLDLRLFVEALAWAPPAARRGRMVDVPLTVRELAEALWPHGWQRGRDLPKLRNAMRAINALGFFSTPDARLEWAPVLWRAIPGQGAHLDDHALLQVQLPPIAGTGAGARFDRLTARRLGVSSAPEFRAYLGLVHEWDRRLIRGVRPRPGHSLPGYSPTDRRLLIFGDDPERAGTRRKRQLDADRAFEGYDQRHGLTAFNASHVVVAAKAGAAEDYHLYFTDKSLWTPNIEHAVALPAKALAEAVADWWNRMLPVDAYRCFVENASPSRRGDPRPSASLSGFSGASYQAAYRPPWRPRRLLPSGRSKVQRTIQTPDGTTSPAGADGRGGARSNRPRDSPSPSPNVWPTGLTTVLTRLNQPPTTTSGSSGVERVGVPSMTVLAAGSLADRAILARPSVPPSATVATSTPWSSAPRGKRPSQHVRREAPDPRLFAAQFDASRDGPAGKAAADPPGRPFSPPAPLSTSFCTPRGCSPFVRGSCGETSSRCGSRRLPRSVSPERCSPAVAGTHARPVAVPASS